VTAATKFIDFFVHDILDYSVMTQNEKNFYKDNTVFDVRESITEIITILEYKTSMKDINVRTLFRGFEHLKPERQSLVKTDQKRLQQVLLNLYSNAVKFTDRQGKITILVELIKDFLRISVTDDGLGIEKKNQKTMF